MPKMTAEEVPFQVVADILSRLPAKTLGRFKCASKQWYNFISDPWFINLHHHRSTRNLNFLYLTSEKKGGNGRSCLRFTSTDSEGKALRVFTIERGFQFHGYSVLHLCSCNGLICINTAYEIYLCNPANQECLVLTPQDYPTIGFGFGFLSSTQEYKIIRLFYDWERKIYCEIFSLIIGKPVGNPSWRVIDEKCPSAARGEPVVINECINWLTLTSGHDEENLKLTVLSFELRSEKFRVLPLPPADHHSGASLFEFGGMLSFFDNYDDHNLKIWTMNDYDKCIWIKACNIDLKQITGIDSKHRHFQAFRHMINGELLIIPRDRSLDSTQYWYYYDIQTHKFSKVPRRKHEGYLCFYSDSMVSF